MSVSKVIPLSDGKISYVSGSKVIPFSAKRSSIRCEPRHPFVISYNVIHLVAKSLLSVIKVYILYTESCNSFLGTYVFSFSFYNISSVSFYQMSSCSRTLFLFWLKYLFIDLIWSCSLLKATNSRSGLSTEILYVGKHWNGISLSLTTCK